MRPSNARLLCPFPFIGHASYNNNSDLQGAITRCATNTSQAGATVQAARLQYLQHRSSLCLWTAPALVRGDTAVEARRNSLRL